jgi:hypothetical protein
MSGAFSLPGYHGAMKKERKQFEQWAKDVLAKIQKVLLLGHFAPLELEYGCKNAGAYAECELTYPYQSITVRYGDLALADWRKKDLESLKNVLIHEMCHPLTDPLYSKATSRYASRDEIEDERERLTDHIANVLIRQKLV